ncbi:MAG: outer membrane beta-barrel protein [Paludibacteraceae bacterium]|nr:outer membrane beta-barrel protein [Paludibacteraceae bacterium]
MKKLLFILLLSATSVLAYGYTKNCLRCDWHGQDDRRGRLTLNFKGGATYGTINQIYSIYEPLVWSPNYDYEIKGKFYPVMSVDLNFGINIFRLDLRATYSLKGASFSKHYTNYDEKYDINYHFVDFSLGAELLIYKGLYMGFFGGYGLNLNPKNGIKYTSNLYENYLEYDNDKQIVTNQSFSGMNDWFAGINLGYEFYSGLVIELNYKAGLSDIINTKSNKYDFRNSFNNTQQISLLIGYSLEFFDHETKRIQRRWR